MKTAIVYVRRTTVRGGEPLIRANQVENDVEAVAM